jgi:hypothetical protein
MRSKILSHFIKGKISMETIITTFNELEYLERLVKLVRKKRNEMLHLNWVAFAAPTILKQGEST